MKEQLISFEAAKLAKEKGLINGIEVEYVYDIGWGKFKSTTDKPISSKTEEGLNYKRTTVKNQFHLALAPTQSLLQRWLRKIHNIHVNGEINDVSNGMYIYNLKWHDGVFKEQSCTSGNHSYEEALEAGLFEALKLIK